MLNDFKYYIFKRMVETKHNDYYELKQFKGKHEGERCFIIGNGPSLTADDLELLKNEICFASNRIYEIYNKTKWRPKYYAISDGNIVKEIAEEAQEKSQADYCFFPSIDCWQMKWNENVLLYRILSNNFCGSFIFSNDISKGIREGWTVTYILTQIAIYMGFKEVYYLGVDCSNFGCHFYQNEVGNKNEISNDTITLSMRSFDKIKEVCKKKNIVVKNATRGGKLEVFERINLEKLLDMR